MKNNDHAGGHRARLLITVGASLVVVSMGMPIDGIARPRQPLPPFPELAPMLWRASFDEAYSYRTTNTQVSVAGYGELVQSWSGYALQRSGVFPPLIVPALDGNGRTNLASHAGAIRFWFRPDWSSSSTDGTGPGTEARLLEAAAVADQRMTVAWSLLVSPDGSALYLEGAGDTGAVVLLSTEIAWSAGAWHLLALDYSPDGTALFVDGNLVAEGAGTVAVPPSVAALVVGSDLQGGGAPGGEFEEVCTFRRPLTPREVEFYFDLARTQAALGPISPQEDQALREVAAKRKVENGALGEGGGAQMMLLIGGTSECISNVPVFVTNIVAAFDTNVGWTVTFDIQGGTNGLLYDIFTTTTLSGNSITNSQWSWLEQGPTCSTYQYTNQPSASGFYVLGTPQDSDADGLTDAYEALVSKTGLQTADTDGDGLSDGYELFTSFTDPLSAGPVPTLSGHSISKCPLP